MYCVNSHCISTDSLLRVTNLSTKSYSIYIHVHQCNHHLGLSDTYHKF